MLTKERTSQKTKHEAGLQQIERACELDEPTFRCAQIAAAIIHTLTYLGQTTYAEGHCSLTCATFRDQKKAPFVGGGGVWGTRNCCADADLRND